jgi:hypothetical protein
MPDIVAIIGDPAANSYLSLEDADRLMDGFPNAKKWLNLDEATRQRILLDGTRKIDRFRGWTPKTATQALAFPTSKDPADALPREVIDALLEFSDFTASGEMASLKKLQAEGVTNKSVLGQNSSFKEDTSQLPAGSRSSLETLWRLYGTPILIQHPVRSMFRPFSTTGSLFNGDLRTPLL